MHSLGPDRIDAPTVIDWLRDPEAVAVIDVRSPAESETAHIAGSYNVPLNLLGEHAAQLAARLDREVVLVCQSGTRAAEGQRRLAGVGAADLHVLGGGVPAYAAAGGRAPEAALLAGGVGAGLALSALTDTCTMGRILAALPHDRGTRERSVAEVIDQLPERRRAA
jgi:rhodanese-related sulfurtransferase